MTTIIENWFARDDVTGREIGPFASFDAAHDAADFGEHSFRVFEAAERETVIAFRD
jgi:hypothetical protein